MDSPEATIGQATKGLPYFFEAFHGCIRSYRHNPCFVRDTSQNAYIIRQNVIANPCFFK